VIVLCDECCLKNFVLYDQVNYGGVTCTYMRLIQYIWKVCWIGKM